MSFTRKKDSFRNKYWVKLALFWACALVVVIGSYVAYQALITLKQLDTIESERDQWQHPTEVIRALGLRPGDSVVDLGCGSGYFSLKLSDTVGSKGKVIAEDIRRLSLTFLWMRSVIKRKHNVHVLLGVFDDPHLHPDTINSVLISNAFHEFTAPKAIMEHVLQSLVPGGKVVIVDRWPRDAQGPGSAFQEHEISPQEVEADLTQTGFSIDSRRDDFIRGDPYGENWWMIVAHRP
jgi:predicted methyltransferase